MAIYISSHTASNSGVYVGNVLPSGVWLSNTQVWPDTATITTELTNVSLYFSSGSTLSADQSNYAYLKGSIVTKRNGTTISTETVYLTPRILDGDYAVADNVLIYWNKDTYGSTVMSQRTIRVTGSYGNVTWAQYATLTLAANSSWSVYQAIGWTAYAPSKVTAQGDVIDITGIREFLRWTRYSSGYESEKTHGWDSVNATYSYVSSSIGWIHDTYHDERLTIDANTTTSDRSATVDAVLYDYTFGNYFTSTITITQYRQGWSRYEARILQNESGHDNTTFQANQYGISNGRGIWIRAEYRRVSWMDGEYNYGPWYRYNGSTPVITPNEAENYDSAFALGFDTDRDHQDMGLVWGNASSGQPFDQICVDEGDYIGIVYVYPKTTNEGANRSTTVTMRLGADEYEVDFAQLGQA